MYVGDRVICIDEKSGSNVFGKRGYINNITDNSVIVEFDEDVSGHTGFGDIPNGHGWWVNTSSLVLSEDDFQDVEITLEITYENFLNP